MHKIFCSDFHIHSKEDEAYRLLIKLLTSPEVEKVDEIFLLGDMFDLMAGNHREYYDRYLEYFKLLGSLLKNGKKISYFEGNHDIHLEKLYLNYFEENKVSTLNFKIYQAPQQFLFSERKIYVSHGDEIKTDDWFYPYYKKIISLKIMGWIANNLIPLKLFEFLWGGALKRSMAKRGREWLPEKFKYLRELYRRGVEKLWDKHRFDVMVCGHTHIQENLIVGSYQYINAGFGIRDRSYILYNGKSFELKKIT